MYGVKVGVGGHLRRKGTLGERIHVKQRQRYNET